MYTNQIYRYVYENNEFWISQSRNLNLPYKHLWFLKEWLKKDMPSKNCGFFNIDYENNLCESSFKTFSLNH